MFLTAISGPNKPSITIDPSMMSPWHLRVYLELYGQRNPVELMLDMYMNVERPHSRSISPDVVRHTKKRRNNPENEF